MSAEVETVDGVRSERGRSNKMPEGVGDSGAAGAGAGTSS